IRSNTKKHGPLPLTVEVLDSLARFSEDDTLAISSLHVLSQDYPEKALPALKAGLRNSSPEMRMVAGKKLVGQRRGTQALEEALSDNDPTIRLNTALEVARQAKHFPKTLRNRALKEVAKLLESSPGEPVLLETLTELNT